ncbi:MAG: hypothetical protein U9R72_07440 [Chloroflexota bacterium]|nr:hypothetical protein [Chloroflexota bacterium]
MILSPEAQKAVDASHSRWRLHHARRERQKARMQPGPYQRQSTIVIPSEWYNQDAADFWKSIGAVWCPGHPDGQAWVLNWTLHTYNGRFWTAEQWLKAIRRKYYSFWPSLKEPTRRCVSCGRVFKPWHPRQEFCSDCTS